MDRDSYVPPNGQIPDKPSFHRADCNYENDNIFNPDCVYCMRLWNEFCEKNNFYVISDKGDKK